MRAKFTSADFETGWYFPETVNLDDVMADRSDPKTMPDMNAYLAHLRERIAGTPTQIESASSVTHEPIKWLAVPGAA